MFIYTPTVLWRGYLVKYMHIRQSLPLVAVLLASMAGCASLLRSADLTTGTGDLDDGQQAVERMPIAASLSEEMPNSLSSVQPTMAETTADGFPINQPLTSSVTYSLTAPSPSSMEQVDENPCLEPQQPPRDLFGYVIADHANYYSRRNLGMLAVGVGAAAIMANTRLDETIQRNYQEDIRDLHTDEFSEALHTPNVLGNGYIMIPAFCGAALVGSWYDDSPLGRNSNEWGQRSLRAILVGGPPMLAMQLVTGASRPGETDNGSMWSSFQDNNGVSGHSFLGAVPFISVAKMTENHFWKAAFYAGSTLAGLSRINDDKHYTSQVMLGWWMAYVAATAVDNTQQARKNLTVFPLPIADGFGAGLEYHW